MAEDTRFAPRVERRLALARGALFWELLWPALWPAVGVAGAFVALALLDPWDYVSPWLHAAILAGFALALAGALWRARRGFALPPRAAALRRLERDSGFAHRPLATLEDVPAAAVPTPELQAVWQVHQGRMRALLQRLRLRPPSPGLVRLDRFALRGLLLLLLLLGLGIAGDGAGERLRRAVQPGLGGPPPAPPRLDAWINPPPYTGQPPVLVTREGAGAAQLKVPVNSTLLARVHGGRGVPELVLDGNSTAFQSIDPQNHQLSAELRIGGRLAVTQNGKELGAWPLEIVPDLPPTAALTKEPAATNRAALRLDYEAKDDYGLAKVVARLVRDGAPADEAALEIDLSKPGGNTKQLRDTRFEDLTPNPWAGLEVTLTLIATDSIGQTGQSESAKLTLPERKFKHPVARAIVEQRKKLAREPDHAQQVVAGLEAIALAPEAFFEDLGAFLNLRAATYRLKGAIAYPPTRAQQVAEVQDILWRTALKIEDGDLSQAERDLRQAQQALMDALNRNAPDEEIQRLMDELQQAMQRYMQAMAEQLLRQMQRGEAPPQLDPNSQRLQSQDLQRMLDRARELARSGARDAAKQLLSQLQQMLENMRMGLAPQSQPGGEAGQMMQELGDLMRKQQQLMDRTFRQSQRGQNQQGQQGQPGDMAGEQEGLRRQLGELMRRLGEGMGQIPDPLGRAEQFMRDAQRQLEQGRPGQAVGPQGDALDQLRSGAQEMARSMQNQMGEGDGFGPPPEGYNRFNPSRDMDPLGRNVPGHGMDTGDRVEIPDKADLQRARDILDELYRRSGDRSRPPVELDYLDRLLRRF
jgi:uncharacterized protein (TIGR02302 family)